MQAVVNIQTGLVRRFIADIHPDWVNPEGYELRDADKPPEGGWVPEPKPEPKPEPTSEEKLKEAAAEVLENPDRVVSLARLTDTLWLLQKIGKVTEQEVAALTEALAAPGPFEKAGE